MLELKVFQSDSAKLMADRYAFYSDHPDRPRKGKKPRPFFQALSALTGAGKTPILAQAVSLMRAHFSSEPIVLWMSKAKSVVAQTYTNFSVGGKYNEIIEGFRVINVQSISPSLIADGSTPLLIMTTTGLFNNKDQAEGVLTIYKRSADTFGEASPWERLISRTYDGVRRPLLIVYDEGHNLSEQQTELLAELEPDAYLLASATLKLPANFQKSVITPIRLWVEETEDNSDFVRLQSTNESGQTEAERFITTAVSSEKVVTAQLVKKSIQFDGTTAPMERCIEDLIKRFGILKAEIQRQQLSIKPKAIYVCKTNINDDGDKDDASKPFNLRNAPPIRIWRTLVEDKGISPADIAIYANLNFVDGNKPNEVNLFSKGENDFDTFQKGDFHHIIFNLSLQEGWDDPGCYLAYIDKSMGSSIQVEQIIGRVLRQYDATHYDSPLLNSAHFFIRVDSQNVFSEAIKNVKTKLQSEGAAIEIIENFGKTGGTGDDLEPKEDAQVELHHIYVDSDAATDRITEILDAFPVLSEGDVNTVGVAHTATQIVNLEELGKEQEITEWRLDGHTNPVRLRWLINTAIRARSTRVLAAVSLKDPKFDVRVQVQSKAEKWADKLASDVVEAFFQHSDLVYERLKPFAFGTIHVPKSATSFASGLYDRYYGFNKFELPFAEALDAVCAATTHIWHRNPSSGGFSIPLLDEGDTASFFPDFIVWKKGSIYCLDTKGVHLLSDAVVRKLFDIKEDGKTVIQVRFISEGKQTALRGKAIKGGYTVWKMKSGSPTPIHVSDLAKAVAECLR